MTFLSGNFSRKKLQFHLSALMYVAMATMQLFGLFLKTRITIVFQVFQPERNFLWDNFLCFGHHNTLRSLIEAHIRSVTADILQKFICPNMVIDTNRTHKCLVPQSIISIIRDINSLSGSIIYSLSDPDWFFGGSIMVYNYMFSSFKRFEPSYCCSTDFDGFGGNREQLDIPLVP